MSQLARDLHGPTAPIPNTGLSGPGPTAATSTHARARPLHTADGPGDPDRGRLELVLRPLPDHLAALGLLPRRPRQHPGLDRALRARGRQRPRLLRLDPAPRARPRPDRASATRSGSRRSRSGCSAASPRSTASPIGRGRVPDRRRRAGGDAADHRRLPRRRCRDRRRHLLGRGELRRERDDLHRRRRARLARQHQRRDPDLQPAARVPARRRPDRPRDRLEGHRQPRAGDDLRRPPRPGLRLRVHRDRHPDRARRHAVRGRLAGADRLDARRLRPRDGRAQQAEHEARRICGSPT